MNVHELLEEQQVDDPDSPPLTPGTTTSCTKKLTQSVLTFAKTSTPTSNATSQPQETMSMKSTSKNNQKKKRSIIWELFDNTEEDSIKKCRICKDMVKTSGNTTNGTRHLNLHHKLEYLKILKKMEGIDNSDTPDTDIDSTKETELEAEADYENGGTDADTNNNAINKNNENSTINSEKTTTGQTKKKRAPKQVSSKTILKRKCKKKPYTFNSKKKAQLDKALLLMITKDFQPFSIVEDVGFIKFIHALDNRYILPCPDTVTKKLMPQYYEGVETKMKRILDGKYVSITYDTWTSVSKYNYLTVTGHFIFKNEIRRCTLTFNEVSESHESDFVEKIIENNVINVYPTSKFVSCVSDNASNMIAIARKLDIKHLPCCIHSIQLVIRDALIDSSPKPVKEEFKKNPMATEILDIDGVLDKSQTKSTDKKKNESEEEITVPSILKKVKDVTTAFNQSTKLTDQLRKELKLKDVKTKTLLQDTPTRWNSTYLMLDRYYSLHNDVNVVLARNKKIELMLSEEELAVIPDILLILKPFLEITKHLSVEGLTISLVIPYISQLITEVKKMAFSTNLGKEFGKCIHSQSKRRLTKFEANKLVQCATVLDPRFKNAGFMNPDNFKNAYAHITTKLKEKFENQCKKTVTATSKQGASEPPPPGLLGGLFGCGDYSPSQSNPKSKTTKNVPQPPREINAVSKAIVQFNTYVYESRLPYSTNVLQFWANYDLKELREVAEEILITPASSVSSERDFSAAGNVIYKRRASLFPDTVKKIMYLNKNMDYMDVEIDDKCE